MKRFEFAAWDALGKLRFDETGVEHYLTTLSEVFNMDSLRQFKIVADCCNGTSSLILHRIQERFGLNLILLNAQMEGVMFAHEPATTGRTVALQLAPLMQPLGADAGFLFDVDSDRVAIATEIGEPVSEEMMLPLLADYLLPRVPGKLVITNLSTTALLDDVVSRHGGRVIRVSVGRQAAIDALSSYRPEQVALAGEGTGAVMMPQFRFVYDGIASMLALLSMMRERAATLSSILASYPKYSILKGEVPLVSQRIPRLLTNLQRTYGDGRLNVLDGLRVDWPNRWFHVRVSQTEPIVRIICEQRGEPPLELYHALVEEVRSLA